MKTSDLKALLAPYTGAKIVRLPKQRTALSDRLKKARASK